MCARLLQICSVSHDRGPSSVCLSSPSVFQEKDTSQHPALPSGCDSWRASSLATPAGKSEEEKEMEGVWGMMEKPCVECAIIRGLMEEETCATFVHVVFDPVMPLVLTDDQLVSVNHSRTNVGR